MLRFNLFQKSISSFAVSLCTLSIVGCSSTPTELNLVDKVEFKGDAGQKVTSSDHARRNYANLSEGETIVFAIASDNSGAISHPNRVEAQVTEVIAENREKSLEQMRNSCDVDSDGIWDGYCPQLLNELQKSKNEKVVMFETLYSLSDDTGGRDSWGTEIGFDKGEAAISAKPMFVRLISVNRGNKTFSGDLDILVNVPPQVQFTQVRDLYKISSNAGKKAVVGGILGALTTASALATGNPYLAGSGGLENIIKDFNRMESYRDFATDRNGERLSIKANNISIEPGQGVELIYEVSYSHDGQ